MRKPIDPYGNKTKEVLKIKKKNIISQKFYFYGIRV